MTKLIIWIYDGFGLPCGLCSVMQLCLLRDKCQRFELIADEKKNAHCRTFIVRCCFILRRCVIKLLIFGLITAMGGRWGKLNIATMDITIIFYDDFFMHVIGERQWRPVRVESAIEVGFALRLGS